MSDEPFVPGLGVSVPTTIAESLEELYHEAPCGYLSSSPDGTILSVNRTFLAWTGYEESQLVGRRSLQDLLTPGGRIYHETHYRPLLRMQGSVREIALEIVCADGRELPVLMNSILRADGDREVVRTIVIDATERRAYEQELLRARRAAEDAEGRARLLARTLQQSLMPPSLPAVPSIELGASYHPAGDGSDVGGDFFDVFGLGERAWGVVIGDVEGKGPEAAAVTALARYTVRAAAVQDRRPGPVLGTLNRALLIDPATKFCTVAYALLEPRATGGVVMRSAVAGHPLPILVSRRGELSPIGSPGTLAGAFDAAFHVEDTETELEPGDLVVFYTDGLVEARGASSLFGDERLLEAIERHRNANAPGIASLLTEEALAFQDGVAHDDIAVIALRVR